jgi:hypothetical protein
MSKEANKHRDIRRSTSSVLELSQIWQIMVLVEGKKRKGIN